MKKLVYPWVALFLLMSVVHGRELQYPPQQRTVETPIAEPGGRFNVPLIVCSSVFAAVIVAAVIVAVVIHRHVVKHRQQRIVYHLR